MHDHRLRAELAALRSAEPPRVDVVDRVLAELPRLRLEPRDVPPARRLWMIAAAAMSGAVFSLDGLWRAVLRVAPESDEAMIVAGGVGDALAGLVAPLTVVFEAAPQTAAALWNAAIEWLSSYSPLITAFAVTGTIAATATVLLVVAHDFKRPTVVREDTP